MFCVESRCRSYSRSGVDSKSPLPFTQRFCRLSTQAQRPLPPKVRAASLCPRALSTTEHASKLSRAPLLSDSSRSYEAMQDSGNGEFGPVAYVRTTQTNAAAILCSPGQAGRPLWSGEWPKRAGAASKCLGKPFVAHFDHAVRDRVVEADLPEALLRDSAVREHARSATRSSAVGWALGSILGSKESLLYRCLLLPRGLGGDAVAGVVVVAPQRRARGEHAACRVEEAGAARAGHL